jgi:hypothetical protein
MVMLAEITSSDAIRKLNEDKVIDTDIWYADKIGQEFAVVPYNNYLYTVNSGKYKGKLIAAEDVRVHGGWMR